ncbi:hypothetical protein M501DRAFT_1057451 [Patellaria atrata CBS 101060]|uniref:Uncharacterized protein n=1 Tax=Patellaria atrata CBS 101060 TaxID=1346257 RepID=A0A9P4SAL7_9PEZI|nr:hypothetical protein M501DRAFT_1057451 [Patellaria atrata CBS 101060]
MPSSTNPKSTPPTSTKASIIKAYGGRPNFQHSFGLKMTPDDLKEGDHIIETFLEQDRQIANEQKSS